MTEFPDPTYEAMLDERELRGLGPRTRPDDPAYQLLLDGYTSTPRVHREGCYICEDPEFSQMGLPLCTPCPRCQAGGRTGHMPADDPECSDCGYSLYDGPYAEDPVRDHNRERGAMMDEVWWVSNFLARAWKQGDR